MDISFSNYLPHLRLNSSRIGLGVRLSILTCLISSLHMFPAFASDWSTSQSSNYQENTLSIDPNDLKSNVTLMISGQSANTTLDLKVRLNGKLVNLAKHSKRAEISLNKCFVNHSCVIDISGNYAPSGSGIITQVVSASSNSRQESGGNGAISQRIQLFSK